MDTAVWRNLGMVLSKLLGYLLLVAVSIVMVFALVVVTFMGAGLVLVLFPLAFMFYPFVFIASFWE